MVDIASIILRFGEILVAPAQNLEMLWIIIPVYLSGILADYYQEKKGTSLGNVISNGFVAMWVGLDWGKQLTAKIDFAALTLLNAVQAAMTILLLVYGFFIMFEGMKGKGLSRYIGRVREVTYFIICLSPIFYGVVPIDLDTITAIAVFFPIWYIIFEVVMKLAPNPISIEEEESGLGKEFGGEGELPGGMEGLGGMEGTGQQQYPQQQYPPQYPQQYPPQYPQQYPRQQRKYPPY
jgi:hypothetical protein